MNLNIRPAHTGDLIFLVNAQMAMAKETEDKSLNQQTLIKGIKHLMNNPELGEYIVAELGSKSIACLLNLNEWSDWRNGNVIWIHSLYVAPEFRKKGVFNRLYEYVKNKVDQDPSFMGIRLYVDQTNAAAQEAYKKMGMDGEHYKVYEWMPGD